MSRRGRRMCTILTAGMLISGCAGWPHGDGFNVEPVTAADGGELRRAWQARGFLTPEFHRLRTRSGVAASHSHRVNGLLLVASRLAGWTVAEVEAFTAHLPRRLADCGVRLGDVLLVITDPAPAQRVSLVRFPADEPRAARELLARIPEPGGPVLAFVGALGPVARSPSTGVGGMAAVTAGRSGGHATGAIAFVARETADGRRFRPEQTAAHELGHLLGLAHTSPGSGTAFNVMDPRGCELCAFTVRQCRAIRSHTWVRPHPE